MLHWRDELGVSRTGERLYTAHYQADKACTNIKTRWSFDEVGPGAYSDPDRYGDTKGRDITGFAGNPGKKESACNTYLFEDQHSSDKCSDRQPDFLFAKGSGHKHDGLDAHDVKKEAGEETPEQWFCA